MIKDNDLIFDKETKRFYLTEDYVLNKMGTDLQKVAFDELDQNLSTFNQRQIEYACDMIYDFIEMNAVHRDSALYGIAVDKDKNRAVKKALEYQLFDFIQKGDASMGENAKASDTVNVRAIQKLIGADVFNSIYFNIPEDVNEW